MKYLFGSLLLLFLAGCQKENFEVVQEEPESSFVLDEEVKGMIQSVVCHDGSFDDAVDESSCFSINFPYEVLQKGKTIPIRGIEDLQFINPYYPVVPKFPVVLSFATYETIEVSSEETFRTLIASCANGELYNERIVCVDLQYPVSVSLYEAQSQTFETITFNHDKDVFTGVQEIPEAALVSLQFPITLLYYDGTSKAIQNTEDLKVSIVRVVSVCD